MIIEKSDSEPDETGLKRNKMSLLKGTESVFASDPPCKYGISYSQRYP